jgi:trkA-N domain protein
VTEHLKFSEKYRIFEFKAPKKIIGKSLIELNLRKKYEMNVIGIKRKGEELRISLLPDEKILENDMLLVVVNVEKMIQFNREYLGN